MIEQIYPLYQAQLAKENAVDFNDLLLKVLDLFKIEEVAQHLRLRFRHVLVDEFQDTNRVQYDLVSQFAEATRNLTVVGDDDQSIYAWRGAEPRNLLDFDRDFPDATVIKLEQNYRSTQIDPRRRERRSSARTAIATRSRCGPSTGGGEPIEIYQAGDERGEAYFIAQSIRRALDEGPYLAERHRDPVPDQRAVARARGAPARGAGAGEGRRRGVVLRAQGGQGRDRVPPPPRQSGRGLGVRARGQRAGARHRRDHGRPAARGGARDAASGLLEAARLAARGEVAGARGGAAQEAACVRRAASTGSAT